MPKVLVYDDFLFMHATLAHLNTRYEKLVSLIVEDPRVLHGTTKPVFVIYDMADDALFCGGDTWEDARLVLGSNERNNSLAFKPNAAYKMA